MIPFKNQIRNLYQSSGIQHPASKKNFFSIENNVFNLHIKCCAMNCFMKKILLLTCTIFGYFFTNAQLLTWSPQFPSDNSTVTITVDATRGNQGLQGYTGPVYLHFGLITSLSTNSS